MNLLTVVTALAQVTLLLVVGDAIGRLFLHRAFQEVPKGGPERGLAAVVGALFFSIGVMLLHILSRGFVLRTPIVVLGLAAAVIWTARSWPAPRRLPLRPVPLIVATVVLVALYLLPALVAGSSLRTGDPPWHLGWTEQLLAGEPVPVGPAPEFAANAYPWGYHAVLATMVRLVPGSDALVAHEAMHLLILGSLPLAAAVLARLLALRAGWCAAWAVALIGGFGWITARTPYFEPSPSEGIHGADLVVASPNSLYELFPPALPRELGLVALAAAGWLLCEAARANDRRARVVAGGAAGIVGLISVPMFVTLVAWLVATTIVRRKSDGVRGALAILVPAIAVFVLWAIPVTLRYLQNDGFVDITPRLGMEWPVPTALAAWGLLLPFGIFGAAIAARGRSREGAVLFSFLIASMTLLVFALARGVFNWDLWGNATVLHQGRIWPPAHMLAAVFGGYGALRMWDYLRTRSHLLAAAVAVIVVSGAGASPVLASMRLTEIMRDGGAGFVYGSDDIQDDDSFVARAASELGPDDVVLVNGSDGLAFLLFQFSGCRLARFEDPNLEGNDLRIRYAALAEAWNDRIAGPGFEPDYVAVPYDGVGTLGGEEPVATGTFEGEPWALYQPDS